SIKCSKATRNRPLQAGRFAQNRLKAARISLLTRGGHFSGMSKMSGIGLHIFGAKNVSYISPSSPITNSIPPVPEIANDCLHDVHSPQAVKMYSIQSGSHSS